MNVRGDFLGPPHGTTTRALVEVFFYYFKINRNHFFRRFTVTVKCITHLFISETMPFLANENMK